MKHSSSQLGVLQGASGNTRNHFTLCLIHFLVANQSLGIDFKKENPTPTSEKLIESVYLYSRI